MASCTAHKMSVLLGTVVFCCVSACSAKDQPQAGTDSVDLVGQLTTAVCGGASSCCTSRGLVFDQAGCETTAKAWLSRQKQPPNTVYEPSALPACAAELRSTVGGCGPISTDGACSRLYVGTLKTGETCSDLFGRDCMPIAGAIVFCGAVCGANRFVGAGAPCSTTCSVHGFCDLENPDAGAPADRGACNLVDGLVCLGGTCQPAPGPGQPCTPANDCAPGSGCLFSDPPMMCVALAGEGQSCADTGCTKGLYCGTGLLCAPLKAAGEPCTGPDQCVTGVCTSSRCYLPADRWTAAACAGALPF